METRTLTLEVPEEVIRLVGSPEAAAALAKEALVMELLRRVEISQGQAARLLGITRWDILELMGKYNVESGPETVEEFRREGEALERWFEAQRRSDQRSDQQNGSRQQ